MDFALMSCPYCGRAVDSNISDKYVCEGCGKSIYVDRSNVLSFIRPNESEGRMKEAIVAIGDGSEKKALEIADELVQATESGDCDSLFLRGFIYAEIGEDGKALADWRKGLELLAKDSNLDAYICLMSKAISDMILYKEKEFIEFSVLQYIDRICDDIDTFAEVSSKAFFYYTIYRNCISNIAASEEDAEYYKDILPLLFRRVVAYYRNFWSLPRIIDEYLQNVGYNAETYDDDDNGVAHIYDLLRTRIWQSISTMTDDDRKRIFDRWNDKALKEEIEPKLDSLIGAKKTILGFLLKKDESVSPDESAINAIKEYVDKCLREVKEPEPAPEVESAEAAPAKKMLSIKLPEKPSGDEAQQIQEQNAPAELENGVAAQSEDKSDPEQTVVSEQKPASEPVQNVQEQVIASESVPHGSEPVPEQAQENAPEAPAESDKTDSN